MYVYEKYLEAGTGVSFKGKGLTWNTADDVAPVVKAINECKSLKYLELEGNTLGVDAAKEIGKALESHPELEIALWKDMFTTRLKTEIPAALSFLFAGIDLAGAHLQRLDLSDNAIGPMAMPGIVPFFQTPSSSYIEELIVNNEGLGAEGGTTFSEALMNCLELSKSTQRILQLKVFQCGRNRQDNKGTIGWAKLFEAMGTLEEVHMPQNGINPIAVKALANAFRNNPNLRVINLEDNTIRYDGAEMLAEVLPGLVNLEELNLSDCLIKCAGAKHIASGIRDLRKLQTLYLYSNEIKSEGGLVLASVLRTLPTLTRVSLSNNEFGIEGVEQIEKLLSNLEEVTIIDDEGEEGDGQLDVEGEDEEEEHHNNSRLNDSYDTAQEEQSSVTEEISIQGNPKKQTTTEEMIQDCILELTVQHAHNILPYFREQTEYNFHDLCILAAVTVSKMTGPKTEANFKVLLDEAVKHTDANGFATSLVTCLGYIKPEKGEKVLIDKPNSSTLRALSEYMGSGPVTVTILQCVYHIISEVCSTETFNLLNEDYKKLLEVIKKRLAPIPERYLYVKFI